MEKDVQRRGRVGVRMAMLLLLGTVLGMGTAFATHGVVPGPIALTGQTAPTVMDTRILILRDHSRRLELSDVLAGPAREWFTHSGSGVPAFGFSPDVFWVKFRLHGGSGVELHTVVELQATRFELLDWFVVKGGVVVDSEAGGNLRPRKGLKLDTRQPAFPVSLAPGEDVDVYLRAETETSILFPITVYSGYESYTSAVVRQEWGGFAFCGLAATIFVLSLALGILLHQRLFLLNALISALLMLEYAIFHSYWAWFDLPYATYLVRQPTLALVIALSIGVGLFTMESFSDFPLPRWLRRAWGWTVVVLLALMVLVLFLPYPASGRIAMSVHLVTSFICLILTSWFYLVRKKATLRLMMLGWLVNLGLMLVLQLQWYGVIPSWLPVQGAMTEFLGIIALLFLVASMDRFHQLLQGQVRTKMLEQELAEARLRMLRYQVNPHFLFNSLNSAISLAREDLRTTDFLRRLARFLRASLDEGAGMTVPLADEVQKLEAYLDVEKVRFGERLDWSFEIAPGTSECLVPELMLQPLVENAIKHGMRRAPFVLQVRVRVARDGHVLCVEVANTGSLRPPDAPGCKREGVGLVNLRNRLALIYKGDGQFTLVQEGEWVFARIRVPFSQRTVTPDMPRSEPGSFDPGLRCNT